MNIKFTICINKCYTRIHLLSWRYKKDILPARSTPSCVRSEPYVYPIVENCLSSPAELHTAGKRDKANCTIPSGKPIRNPSFHHEVVDASLKFSKTLGTKGSSFAKNFMTSGMISALQSRIYSRPFTFSDEVRENLKFLWFSWDMRRIFQQTFETRSEFCIGWVFFISSRSQCNHVLSTTGASTVCSRLPLEIRKINKTGTSKVGAISKAQKAQSFLLCPGCIHEKL